MKPIITITCTFLCVSFAHGWWVVKPDYPKQYEQSDLGAIVRATNFSENGIKKEIQAYPNIEFREVEVEFEILSTLKGKSPKRIKCAFYRFPTEGEYLSDNPSASSRGYIIMRVNQIENKLCIPEESRDYLVYLQIAQDGDYKPTTGFSVPILSIRELSEPVNLNIKMVDQDGAGQRR